MKKTFWDNVILFFTIAILFTIGFHLCHKKNVSTIEEYNMTVEILNIKGECRENTMVLIDGKYKTSIITIDRSFITVNIPGEMKNAGLFAFRSKYFSPNQPITFNGDSLYIEGRILAIYTANNPTLHKINT